MSHAPSPEPADAAPQSASRRKSGGALRVVLFAVMFVMAGLWLWDRYARSASQAAYEKVEQAVETGSDDLTPEEMHELLGRTPDGELSDHGHYGLEKYSWRRGMLFGQYVLTVVYRKEGEQFLLYEASFNQELDENDLPNAPNGVENAEAKATTE